MLLLLVRHALAAERDPLEYPDDTLRPLVAKGKKVARRLAAELVAAGHVPTLILSSPWKRAWQSAGVLAEVALDDKSARVACPPLAEDPNLQSIAAAVGKQDASAVVALVGHEPWLGELASLLLTGSVTRLSIDFPKSGILAIEIEAIAPSGGRLRFFIRP